MASTFACGRFQLELGRPLVMGIVNVTPDSFSDGGRHDAPQAAVAHAQQLIAEGADILDLGGESTRPGAPAVPAAEELRRLLPVLAALRDCGVPLSVDTFKPEVMRAVLDAGADMINDIYGFRQPGAIEAVAASHCGLCLMHMQGEPRTMQNHPEYADLRGEVEDFLLTQARALRAAGVAPQRIMLDPGFGFGKTMDQNYQLLRDLAGLGSPYPLLVGVSRKSMIGAATGRAVDQRLPGSLAAALAGAARGAAVLRVHDVAATVDALKVWRAVETGVIST
ncbi:dihydropteroate synthase [Bordetella trematum]|uniref:dihydropteroate synthase n=1 Tax=Bordetella trematum TaxID=123899 RepID=UPI0004707324|nr:dihydropteroate synthase [Bordetella trematum]AUL46452.1 dihydropteroate synthase [Bordetella trematum]QIM71825.1 dihydropteroate synthase [Bordetella trematum]